jgi:hypothetical protein
MSTMKWRWQSSKWSWKIWQSLFFLIPCMLKKRTLEEIIAISGMAWIDDVGYTSILLMHFNGNGI